MMMMSDPVTALKLNNPDVVQALEEVSFCKQTQELAIGSGTRWPKARRYTFYTWFRHSQLHLPKLAY